ncbi:MAG: DUF6785 family protein [Armatimonadota bacterium]
MPATISPPTQARPRPQVTLRAIVLGCVLIPFNVYWVMMVEGIWHTGHPSVMALPWGVVFNIIVLLLLNQLLKWLVPKHALTQAEFVTVWAMVGVAVMLAGHDTLQLGVPNLSYGWWFGTEANHWDKLFQDYLPKFLTVSDPSVLGPFYQGQSSLYYKPFILAWLGPVVWWCAIVFATGLVMTGINVLMRRQWTENERLGYPLVQLPMAMTADGGSREFFGNKVLWWGIGVAVFINLVNGLHHFWPAIPLIDVRHDGNHYLETGPWGRPWNAMGRVPLPLYPFCIALGFMVPLDLCFSMWFFFLVRKFVQVGAVAVPIQMMPGLPYLDAQSIGSWVAVFGYGIWVARRHLADLGRQLWSGALSDEAHQGDAMSYRSAFFALLGGLGFLVFVLLKAGMTLPSLISFLAFAFMMHTTVTRMRAEMGPPAHEMAGNMNAVSAQVIFAGTKGVGARNLTIFPLFWWLTGRGYRTSPMPVQLEAFKMAEVSRAEPQRLAMATVIAFALGAIFSYWSAIHLTYEHGNSMLIGHNGGQWSQLASQINYPEPASWQKMAFVGVGAVLTLGMTWMRMNYLWWPLHPGGYAMGMLFGTDYFWSCLLIAWLVKISILRWGGHKAHRNFMPFVFGIIIGEYFMGAFWSAFSVIIKQAIYDFSPG